MKTTPLAILLMLAACNGKNNDGSDTTDNADTTDTVDTDTGTPAPAVGVIDVTVASGGAPVIGATVAFHDVDGSVLGTGTTDANGAASFDTFPSGGGVTAAVADTARILVSALGLEPNDDVTLDPGFGGTFEVGQADVLVESAFVGGTNHYVHYGCGRRTATPGVALELALRDNCVSTDNRATFVATSEDASGDVVAFEVQRNVLIPATSTPSVTFDSWREDLGSFGLSAINAPANVVDLDVEHFEVDGGISVYASSNQSEPLTEGGSATFTFDEVIGELEGVGVLTQLVFDSASNGTISARYSTYASVPATVNTDLSTDLWPRAHESDVDLDAGTVVWTEDSPVTGADVLLLQLTWEIGTDSYVWVISAPPPSEPEFVVPQLPESLAAWWPTQASEFSRAPAVIYLDNSTVTDWAEVRTAVPPRMLSRPFDYPAPFDLKLLQAL